MIVPGAFHQTKTNADVLGGGDVRNPQGPIPKIDQLLFRAVDVALVSALGESGAGAIKFYVDTTLIWKDPVLFESSLKKVFGGSEKGQGLIEKKIEEVLVRLFWEEYSINIPAEEWERSGGKMTLGEFVNACRQRYNTKIVQQQ